MAEGKDRFERIHGTTTSSPLPIKERKKEIMKQLKK